MRAAAFALLLAATAAAEVETPLGHYARLGIPVLLKSDTPVVVDLDGWKFRVEGTTPVFPPALPCTVRDEGGNVLLTLEDAGDRALLGFVGDLPPDRKDAVPIRPVALAAGCWRALDLFNVLVAGTVRGDEPWFPCVATWVAAGGSFVCLDAPGLFLDGTGLGAVADRVEDLPPRRIPRPGNVRPDLYGLVQKVARGSPPLRSARLVVAGAALAAALQLVLALVGRLRARTLLLGLAAVSIAGAAVGLLRTRADYTPLARGRIEVSYAMGGVERRRSYLVYRSAGASARAPRAPDAAPMLFGSFRAPWWRGPGEEAPIDGPGVIRIFLVEELVRAPAPPPFEGAEPQADLWDRERPLRGKVEAKASPLLAPRAGQDTVLLAIRAVVQD